MKFATSGMIALLNSKQQFCVADLYEIQPVGGSALFFNNSDIDLISSGITWLANGPLIKHDKISNKIGLEVDEVDLEITPKSTDLIGGVTWKTAARTGLLDSASIAIYTMIMPTWGDTSLGAVHRFSGSVGPLDFDDMTIFITARSQLELLNVMLPKNLHQPGCIHTLFDTGCGLTRASTPYTVDTGAGTPTKTSIPISASLIPSPYWELGTIEFTSGANVGIKRSIKSHPSAQQIIISLPLPNIPANGDGVALVAGCNKLQSTCSSKFSNLNNFRGYPYIPVAETAQ